jgi:hypothetical protein
MFHPFGTPCGIPPKPHPKCGMFHPFGTNCPHGNLFI